MNFIVKFNENARSFNINFDDFSDGSSSLKVGFTDVVVVVDQESMPKYEGDYVVAPSISEQVLETASKMMTDNLTITEIPYSEVSNLSGGLTAKIGNEV